MTRDLIVQVTSIIIFLGSVINVLYYLGVMQYIIGKIAWLMQRCLNTTAAEVTFGTVLVSTEIRCFRLVDERRGEYLRWHE